MSIFLSIPLSFQIDLINDNYSYYLATDFINKIPQMFTMHFVIN